MKTDHVDLVQVHAYDVSAPTPDDVIEAVMDARDAGKTRFVGYSGENEDAEWAIQTGLFDTLQASFNLVDQWPRYGAFERASEKGIGFIAKRPIANAVWGKAGSAGDAELTGNNAERLRRARTMLEQGPIADGPEDPIALALGFVLSHDEVGTAIVGTRNPEHMLAKHRRRRDPAAACRLHHRRPTREARSRRPRLAPESTDLTVCSLAPCRGASRRAPPLAGSTALNIEDDSRSRPNETPTPK